MEAIWILIRLLGKKMPFVHKLTPRLSSQKRVAQLEMQKEFVLSAPFAQSASNTR
jgi:hypothetical protein